MPNENSTVVQESCYIKDKAREVKLTGKVEFRHFYIQPRNSSQRILERSECLCLYKVIVI